MPFGRLFIISFYSEVDMKKIIKKISCFVFFVYSAFWGALANAQIKSKDLSGINNPAKKLADSGGFDTANASVGGLLAKVLTAFLSLLAIIFIALIILAGYNWMTAAGEEQKVTKAKETIQKAVIGLIIIMSAYAITAFVFGALPNGNVVP